jgi:hypothetical protein
VFLDARPGYVQLTAQEDRAAGDGGHLGRPAWRLACRGDRVGSKRTGWAACYDANDIVWIGAVGQDPRSPAKVEDGRQSTKTFGRVSAACAVEAHLDGLAVISLARGWRTRTVSHQQMMPRDSLTDGSR